MCPRQQFLGNAIGTNVAKYEIEKREGLSYFPEELETERGFSSFWLRLLGWGGGKRTLAGAEKDKLLQHPLNLILKMTFYDCLWAWEESNNSQLCYPGMMAGIDTQLYYTFSEAAKTSILKIMFKL